LFARCGRSVFSAEPIIESASGDFENTAHRNDGKALALFFYPGVLRTYMISLAKYAVAFFRISISTLS
jgi:hypothetical protein